MNKIAVQDKYAENGICFGCGPANENGLQIKSHWENGELISIYNPEEYHQAFPGVVNGGIIGTLFDCHMNWAAATKLFEKNPDDSFPTTVTSEFSVQLKRPTPVNEDLLIKAKIVKINGNKVETKAELLANEKITATATGIFVSVPEDHPAYHRW